MNEPPSKVVSLKGKPIEDPRTPDPKVVAGLRELLEKAESGEIKGYAAVSLHADDLVSYEIHGLFDQRTLGGLELVKAEMVTRLLAL